MKMGWFIIIVIVVVRSDAYEDETINNFIETSHGDM